MPAATRFWGAAPAPPVDAPAEGQGLLGFFQSGLSGYVPLRSGERTNEEEAYLSLSHWERFLGFLCCLAGSALCFLFSFFFLAPPILALRPHKFALAFTLGNVLFLVGYVARDSPAALPCSRAPGRTCGTCSAPSAGRSAPRTSRRWSARCTLRSARGGAS